MKRVQFIAYQIRTNVKNGRARQDYLGLPDSRKDLRARCDLLLDAICAASRSPHLFPSALVLFAAPEFFFRGGAGGAYTVEEVAAIHEMLDPVLADVRFRNWIFFPGTAVAAMPESPGEPVETLNFCLVRKGGVRVATKGDERRRFDSREKDSVLICKEFLSDTDFIGPYYDERSFLTDPDYAGIVRLHGRRVRIAPTSGARPTDLLAGKGPPNEPGGPNPHVGMERSPTGLGGGSFFTMHGHEFLVEICADHLDGRNRTVVDRFERKPEFHIVVACGARCRIPLARTNGFFFLVDGDGEGADCVELFLVADPDFPPTAPFRRRHAIDMNVPRLWHHHRTDGTELFAAGRGRIYISHVMAMPP